MRYLIVVDHYSSSILPALKKHAAEQAEEFCLVVLTRQPEELSDIFDDSIHTEVIRCSYDDDKELEDALKPFKDKIAGVICRGDKQIQFLRRLIPHLPNNILVSSIEALEIATNKRLMREVFAANYPEITPKFVKIHSSDEDSLTDALKKVPFPVIVKPANLVSSLLIQSCQNEQELKIAMSKIFEVIGDIYQREERLDRPEVLVEEYLEGDFYSIDAYVLGRQDVLFCPPVAYLPAQKIGVDDFFLYKRYVPTMLSQEDTDNANLTTKKAIMSAGLTYTTVHVELIKTSKGWKIIEIGPRIGRFRATMYGQAYGIDHSYNDIAVHLGFEPKIPDKLKKYCSAYSIYPYQEGILEKITGLAELEANPLVYAMKVIGKPGDKAVFAKNGGKAFAEFIIASDNKEKFEALTEHIEENVKAVIRH